MPTWEPFEFETKYVFTLLDRVLINTWRAEVAVNVVKPWLAQRNKMGKDRSFFVQIRRKVQNNVTIDNFVEKVSFVCGILPIHANVQVVVGAIVVVVVVMMMKIVEVVVVLVLVVDF